MRLPCLLCSEGPRFLHDFGGDPVQGRQVTTEWHDRRTSHTHVSLNDMIHDIFATSMEGTFETRRGAEVIEKGSWSYRGFGNAEIEMGADGEFPAESVRYTLRIHSAERRLEHVMAVVQTVGREDDRRQTLSANIAGGEMQLTITDPDSSSREGRLSVPDEVIYDGISPIWLIHLLMTFPPPTDRQVVAPVLSFDPRVGAVTGRFCDIRSDGNHVVIETVDESGERSQRRLVFLADDGCPVRIESNDTVTDIVRIPVTTGGSRH